MCASKLPAECGYNSKSVVFCEEIADVPVVVENCTLACDEPTATCAIDPCACRKIGDACSSSFPPNCNFESNTLYSCSGPKALPQLKQACQKAEICVPIPGGNDICGPDSICDCVGSGDTCSSDFPPSCNKPANLSISCPSGNEIVCANGCASGLCQNGCTCTDDNSKCGSSFAPSCNLLPNAIYSCSTGQQPILASDCGDKACVVNPAATCQDPCLCKDDYKVTRLNTLGVRVSTDVESSPKPNILFNVIRFAVQDSQRVVDSPKQQCTSAVLRELCRLIRRIVSRVASSPVPITSAIHLAYLWSRKLRVCSGR